MAIMSKFTLLYMCLLRRLTGHNAPSNNFVHGVHTGRCVCCMAPMMSLCGLHDMLCVHCKRCIAYLLLTVYVAQHTVTVNAAWHARCHLQMLHAL